MLYVILEVDINNYLFNILFLTKNYIINRYAETYHK